MIDAGPGLTQQHTHKHTHTKLSLLLHSLTRHTKSLWWCSKKWCTGAIERRPWEIHVRCQNRVSSVSIRIFVNFKKILSTNVKQFWMGEKMMCLQLNHTDGISSKGILFKKKNRKRKKNWAEMSNHKNGHWFSSFGGRCNTTSLCVCTSGAGVETVIASLDRFNISPRQNIIMEPLSTSKIQGQSTLGAPSRNGWHTCFTIFFAQRERVRVYPNNNRKNIFCLLFFYTHGERGVFFLTSGSTKKRKRKKLISFAP